jgi:prolyl-tRNA synthetase
MSITRASTLFLPTLREAPADAEAVSHKLLVRGGYIRQVSAGLWSFTPLGWRVHRKVEQIIREEMDAIGARRWLAPVLTPAELWEATGRDKIPELFRLEDRAGRRYVLPLTHEETFTFHARELRATSSCRNAGTTSRRRTATSRAHAVACSVSASSS